MNAKSAARRALRAGLEWRAVVARCRLSIDQDVRFWLSLDWCCAS
jgi:hypothetical protein